MFAAAALGHLLYRMDAARRIAAVPAREDSKGQEDYIVSAVLGLLALLLGFTFAVAVDRFADRRNLVIEEANAIRAAYLQTQLLEEPYRTQISKTLAAYTEHRLAIGGAPRAEAVAMLPADERLIAELWTETLAVFPSIRHLEFSSIYLASMNRLIELNVSRELARVMRVPPPVFFVLFVYVVVTAGVLGYVLVGPHGRTAAAFLLLLLALSLTLIIDMDQPTGGRIAETQEPVRQLKIWMAAQPPAPFQR
jgi:hypothetical protein